MNKTIFLDIDGVVNSPDDMRRRHEEYLVANADIIAKVYATEDEDERKELDKEFDYSLTHDEFGQLFDDRCVDELERIIRETKADIVISSTWRGQGLRAMEDMWRLRGLPGKVVGITPYFTEVDDSIFISEGTFDDYWKDNDRPVRGHEIKQYCRDNNITNYVIIDDDSDMLVSQKERFVCTRGPKGLTKELADEVIKILNG